MNADHITKSFVRSLLQTMLPNDYRRILIELEDEKNGNRLE